MARQSPADKAARIDRVEKAWEKFAPADTFNGITLAKFRKAAREGRDARAEIEEIRALIRRAIAARNAADRKALRVAKHILLAVRDDGNYENSAAKLYAAMTLAPKGARRKSPRRKK